MPTTMPLASASFLARCANFSFACRSARNSKKARAACPLLGRFAAATRPAPGRSRSASYAPRGSPAIAAIEPATGPNPNRCNASAASNLGLVVMLSSRASSSILRKTVPATLPFWHRRRFAAAWVTIVLLAIGTSVVLGVANAPKLWPPQTDLQRSQALVVLPFAADNSGQPDDPAFARVLTHNLIGYLSRFGKLRVISEQTSDFYRERQTDVAHLMTDLGVQYADRKSTRLNSSHLGISYAVFCLKT